jgi:hypothetical protein
MHRFLGPILTINSYNLKIIDSFKINYQQNV